MMRKDHKRCSSAITLVLSAITAAASADSYPAARIGLAPMAHRIAHEDCRLLIIGDSNAVKTSNYVLVGSICRTWQPDTFVGRVSPGLASTNEGIRIGSSITGLDVYPRRMADIPSGDPEVWSNGQDGFIPNRAWDMVANGTGLTWQAAYCAVELTRLDEYPGGDWTHLKPMKSRLIFAHDQSGLSQLRYRAARGSLTGPYTTFTPHDDAERAWIDWVEVGVPLGEGLVHTQVRAPYGWTSDGEGGAGPCPDNCTPGKTFFHVAQLLWRTDEPGLQVDSIAEGGFTLSDHLEDAGHYDDEALRRYMDATRRPNTFLVLLGQNMTSEEANNIGSVWRANLEALLDRYRNAALELDPDEDPLFVLVSPWSTSDTSGRFRAVTDVLAELASAHSDVGFINLHLLAGSHRHTNGTILHDGIHCGSEESADSMAALLWSQIERQNAGLIDHVVEGNGVDLSSMELPDGTNLHIASGLHFGSLRIDNSAISLLGWDIETCGIGVLESGATIHAEGGTNLDIRRMFLLPGSGETDDDGATAGATIHARNCDLRLTDVDMRGGSVEHGGAVALRAASMELHRCRVHGGEASLRGGLIDSVGGSLIALDCALMGGSAQMGGGLCLDGVLNELTNTTVCGNTPDQISGAWGDIGGNCIAENCVECPFDSDGDGVPDDLDQCPGEDDTIDTDSDGTPDCLDAFPNDPNEWADSDNDGVGDNGDACPNDPDNDIDGDGVCGDVDAFPYDPNEWADSDNDGVGDNADNYFENYAHGACCVSSGCDPLTEKSCTNVGGTWLGEGGSCDDCPAICMGDTDGNGVVNIEDLLNMLGSWGACP